MAFTTKQLANGQLAGSKGTLYTVPGATTAIIRSITLVNTGASTRAVNLYVSTGTSRRIIPKDLSLAPGESYIHNEVITLGATHLIEGDAAAANEIDYVISGVEEA